MFVRFPMGAKVLVFQGQTYVGEEDGKTGYSFLDLPEETARNVQQNNVGFTIASPEDTLAEGGTPEQQIAMLTAERDHWKSEYMKTLGGTTGPDVLKTEAENAKPWPDGTGTAESVAMDTGGEKTNENTEGNK